MSLISLLRIENKKIFPKFLACLKIFQNNDPKFMFDKIQYMHWNEHEKSFVGPLLCGESCLILKYLLEQKGFNNIQVFRNSSRTEFGIEDHVFLHIDNIIIDPTYRQFFHDYRSNNLDCLYRKTIFNQMTPILIHYVDDIDLVLKNLLSINKSCYEESFEDYDEIKKNWRFQEDVTSKFNLNKIINEKRVLHPSYLRLIDCLDSFKFNKILK